MALEPTRIPAASLIAPTAMFAAPAMSTVPRVDARSANAAPLVAGYLPMTPSAPGRARYAWSGLPAGGGVVGWDARSRSARGGAAGPEVPPVSPGPGGRVAGLVGAADVAVGHAGRFPGYRRATRRRGGGGARRPGRGGGRLP